MKRTRRDFLVETGMLAAGSAAGLSLVRCSPGESASESDAEGLGLEGYDAVGLADLVRRGEVTPLELVEDVLRRIDLVNPSLNAVLTDLFEADKARRRAEGPLGEGPLSGVPVLLKNLIPYSEAAIDNGSRLFARAIESGTAPSVETSPFVTALEGGGMIVAGITNSPELGLIDTTEPVLHGPTRNPWNPELTPGGSSGGTAAAVAAGIVPLAHGNDGGGSIRLPASQCGIFGLKPTRARELGSMGNDLLAISSELCLSRTVRDTAAFLSVVEDRSVAGLEPVGYVEGPSSERRRIALMTTAFNGEDPHPEVLAAIRSTADLVAELGHEIEEIPLPIDGQAFVDAFVGLWAVSTLEYGPLVAELLGKESAPGDVLEPWTLGLMKLAQDRGPETCIARATEVFTEVNEQMTALFERHDVLLSPVLAVPPFPLGHHDPAGDFDLVYERVTKAVGYTPLQNAAGMPGMSVPLHWTEDGLPVGSQFSAWRGGEAMLLELAYELEEARPWRDRRPGISVES